MSLLPIPDLMLDSIYELTPEMLTSRGIRFVVLDIDNTVAPYTVDQADEAMRAWVDSMRDAGLTLHVLSNNRGHRPEVFSAALGLPFRKKAWKPFPKPPGKIRHREEICLKAGNTAVRCQPAAAFPEILLYPEKICLR